MLALVGVSAALGGEVDRWITRLEADPAAASALRSPDGPLARRWPAVSAPLDRAPVWVLHVDVDPGAGTIAWDGLLVWTAPARAVDEVVLRLPAVQLGGEVEGLWIDGAPAAVEDGFVRVPRAVPAGGTVAIAVRGLTRAPDRDAQARLQRAADRAVFAGWLPLPTPCAPLGCEARPWTGASDPGSHEAMVFLVQVHGAGAGWRLVHPAQDGGAAIGVRELPVVALRGWRSARGEGVRVWAPAGADVRPVVDVAASTRAWLTERYGPLSRPVIEVIAVPDPRQAVELPGMVIVPAEWNARWTPWVVAHEVAHQWWYGEVGSDALSEPWVDESLAEWTASEALGAPRPRDVGLGGPGAGKAGASAADMGEAGWVDVYERGSAYFRALAGVDREGLDRALAEWLRTRRWQFASGEELRTLIAQEIGADAEEAAWCRWMARCPFRPPSPPGDPTVQPGGGGASPDGLK